MPHYRRLPLVLCLFAAALCSAGCTGPLQYVRNGFKVGPNYRTPPAPVAHAWIDAVDKRVRSESDDLAGWWTVFGDPLLDEMMVRAYRQNISLRQAGFRIMEARAQLGIVRGNFFPQQQSANGNFRRFDIGQNGAFSQWNFNFNAAWELDFWGRFRRAIIAAEDSLDASVFDYDDVLVTLLGDVASSYVQVRTTQERIRLLEGIIKIQTDVLSFINERLAAGKGVTELDRAQARSNLKQSQAGLHQLQIDLRVAQNQLCILMGEPAIDLMPLLDAGPKRSIPLTPDYVVVGIPAELLRRRPDVRRAERAAAAQAEAIGIAQAAMYPAFTISGNLGWQAAQLSNLFRPENFTGSVGPSFQWNVLNYGRLLNNVRLQDARFQELVAFYQATALQADLEVENGIINFLQAQGRASDLGESVQESSIALQVIVAQYEAGLAGVDFNRYATIQQTLVSQQDSWAQSRGQIAQGLIQVYRALGGGWQIRLGQVPDKQGILSPLPIIEGPAEVVQPAAEGMPAPQ